MNRLLQGANALLFLSTVLAIFLTFGWPFVVSADPASEPFRLLAIATLVVFLASLSGIVVLNVALGRARISRQR